MEGKENFLYSALTSLKMSSPSLPGWVELSGKHSAMWQFLSTQIICLHVPTTAYGQNTFRSQQIKWHHPTTWNLSEVTFLVYLKTNKQQHQRHCKHHLVVRPLLSVTLSGQLLFYSVQNMMFVWTIENVVISVAQLHTQSLLQFRPTMSYFQFIT